jgi:ABC-type antimicrobial peptide transport system permease subunit
MAIFRSAQLSKSVADVTRRRARTLFVVAGIFLGVFALTAVNVTQRRLAEAFAFSVGSQAARPDLMLDVDRLDQRTLDDLRSIENVRIVQPETTLQTQWYVARAPGHVDMTITAYPDGTRVALNPFELVAGRDPGPGEVVMEFGDTAIQALTIGDRVTVDTLTGPVELSVVGLSRTPGADPATTGSFLGYMSDGAMRELAAATDPITAAPLAPLRVEHLAAKVDRIADVEATTHAIGAVLEAHGTTVFGAGYPDALTAQLQQVDGVFALLRLLTLMALAMTGILVLNTVRTTVAEQTWVIGTMKAIGGTRWPILRGYLVTVAIYGMIATGPALILGIVGGVVLADALARTIPLAMGPPTIDPGLVIAGIAAGIGIPTIAALWPVWDGTRITVRDALSAYGVATVDGRSSFARLTDHLTWLSQTTRLGLRSTFRRRGRAVLTVVMLGVAGASFFIAQTASSSVSSTIGRVWSNVAADVEVYANESYADAQAQLAAVPNIGRMERFGVAGARTSWGKVSVSGFEPETRLYQPRLTGGRWLRPGDISVALVSDELAGKGGLHIGSRLVLTGVGGGRPTTFTVIGTLDEPVDDLGQVGAVVVPVTGLYEFEGTPPEIASGFVNRILVQATDRSPAGIDALARRVDAVAGDLIRSGSVARGTGLGPIFLVHEDEAVRHQRNFLILYVLLYSVALVVGAAGILGLASTLMASVTERRREIGLLRAMGASRRRVAQVFWVEGLALGAAAAGLGVVLGVPLASMFVAAVSSLVIPIDLTFDPIAFLSLVLAILAMVTLASIAPAARASGGRVAELLRYE